MMEKRLMAADMVDKNIPYEIKVESPQISIFNAYSIVSSPDERSRLINVGSDIAAAHLSSIGISG
jgi:cytochrome c